MKNKIVTCLINKHEIYQDSFKSNNIKVRKAYKCIDELLLTASCYYKPEFASLKGITIKSHVDEWGWHSPCLPKECFRLATKKEIRKYKILIALNTPFRFFKILFFKVYHKIDRVLRRKYYEKLQQEYF